MKYRSAAVCLAVLLLAGCGITETLSEKSRIDYKSAQKKPTINQLEVPPDLTNPSADQRFSIPERPAAERTLSGYQRGQSAERERVKTDPRVLPGAEGMHVERSGQQRWLVVNQPPEKLWPIIKDFWQEAGFIIQVDDPATGIMETDWAENRAKLPQDFIRNTLGRVLDSLYSTGERDKFRTRLERGSNNSTEIYISHRGMVEVYNNRDKDQTVWQPRPVDPELEAEFLKRLMVRLGDDQEKASEQVARASKPDAASGQQMVRLISTADIPTVEIREGFDRAWRRVGLALDRGGFTVEDRDRSQGIYYVRYIDPDLEAKAASRKPGFFGKLFSLNSSPEKDSAVRRQYRIKVAGAASDTTEVNVLSRDGQQVTASDDRQTVNRILSLLTEQLRQ